MNWQGVLVVAAVALSGYALVESRGKGALNWAVFALGVALLLDLI